MCIGLLNHTPENTKPAMDWAPIFIGFLLFILLSPGLLFQLPGNVRHVEFGSLTTNGKAMILHTLIFFVIFTILILAVGIRIYIGWFHPRKYRDATKCHYVFTTLLFSIVASYCIFFYFFFILTYNGLAPKLLWKCCGCRTIFSCYIMYDVIFPHYFIYIFFNYWSFVFKTL